MKTAGHLFQMHGFEHTLVAFRRASVAGERSRSALEAGQLKDLPVVLKLSAIVQAETGGEEETRARHSDDPARSLLPQFLPA